MKIHCATLSVGELIVSVLSSPAALTAYKEASALNSASDKLQKKIHRLQKKLRKQREENAMGEGEDEAETHNQDDGFRQDQETGNFLLGTPARPLLQLHLLRIT